MFCSLYDNLEDYICDQNCTERNGLSDDVSLSTNELGHVDNVDGVTCKGTPPYEESEQETDLNPECVTINSPKSQPDCSENVEKVTNECYSNSKSAIVVSNEVPYPVSKCVTPPSSQTSVIITIGQNEQKGSQLQLTMNDGEDNIQVTMIQMNQISLKQMVLIITMMLCMTRILLWIKINVVDLSMRRNVLWMLWIQITISRRKIIMYLKKNRSMSQMRQ